MKTYFKRLFNTACLYLTQDKKENYKFFSHRLQEELPKGLMFLHENIQFFVKDFSSLPDKKSEELNWDEDKLYIICEYFDQDGKYFLEKVFHEDFVRNRYKVFTAIIDKG